MRITFQLRFHTEPGQSLWLVGAHPALGNDKVESAIPLVYADLQSWRVTIDLPPDALPQVPAAYRYILRQKDGALVEDWGNDRLLDPHDLHTEQLLIVDSWNDPGQVANVLCTEPFQKVLLAKPGTAPASAVHARGNHRFEVKAPLLAASEKLCLAGNADGLGGWSTNDPLLLESEVPPASTILRWTWTRQPIRYTINTGSTTRRKNNSSDTRTARTGC
jgi:4-alpha-glucanotransferase